MGEVARAVRHSFRSLARSPAFTVPALVILAIGMTAATAIFTVVDSVVFRPLAFPDAGRLVVLCEENPQVAGHCVASPGNVEDLRAGAITLSELGFGRTWQYFLDDGTGPTGVRGGIATPAFFRALGAQAALGRLFAEGESTPDARVALLSHAFWTERFGGDPAVIGRALSLDGEPFSVVGILPADFQAPFDRGGVQIWRPPHFSPLDPEVRGWRGFVAVGRMAAGATTAATQDELTALYAGIGRAHPEVDDSWRLTVQGLLAQVVGDTRPVLLAFLGAAALLLLVVSANVANLLLARGLGRRRELAVRSALGAARHRLVLGVVTEGLVLSALATTAAVFAAGLATRILLSLAPPEIPRLDEVSVNGRVFAFVAAATLLVTLVFAVLPALRVTSWNLAGTIREGGHLDGAATSGRLRNGLVVVEIALSVMLVASGAVLTRSFLGYLRWEPGFDRERVVAVSAFIPPGKYRTSSDLVPLYREAEAALRAVPGVEAASSASAGPLFGGGDGAVSYATEAWDGVAQLPAATWFDVGPGYFATLGIPLRQGRDLLESDGPGAPVVALVNETLARRAWPEGNAVGRTLRVPDRELTLEVVGVVADVPPLTPGQLPGPELYWSNRQLGRWGTYFVVRTSTSPDALTDALGAVDPDLSLGTPRLLASAERRALVRPRFQALVMLALGLAALALAAAGVYAVVSYSVAFRVREMGIRIALGAGAGEVVGLVVRSSLAVALLGVGGGLLGALGTSRLLEGMVHGVAPLDPASLAVAGGVLTLAAAAAAYLPARRVAATDPLKAIRSD